MSKVAQEKEIGRLIARLDAHVGLGKKLIWFRLTVQWLYSGNSTYSLTLSNHSVERERFTAPTLAEALTEALGAIEDAVSPHCL